MAKVNVRLEAARMSYREALEAARVSPTAEAWSKLLAAGKELSAAEEPRSRGRRPRRAAAPPAELAENVEGPGPVNGQGLAEPVEERPGLD